MISCRALSSSLRWSLCQTSWRTISQRTIVTSFEEPPLDSTVPELPCTVVLLQDNDIYGESSTTNWEKELRRAIPHEFGMSFGAASLHSPALNNSSEDHDDEILEESLTELRNDLSQIMNPQIILIARGPLVSWIAQLHLESNPLAGLVMIDPLLLDDSEADYLKPAIDYLIESLPSNLHSKSSNGRSIHLLQSLYSNRQNMRPLLLEPGSVPMMIFYSFHNQAYLNAVHQTANRHRIAPIDVTADASLTTTTTTTTTTAVEGLPEEELPVVSLALSEEEEEEETPILKDFESKIFPWIKVRAL